MRRFAWLAGMVIVSLALDAGPSTDVEAIRATLNQYVAAWLAGDADGVMKLLTEDSVLVPAEKPPYIGSKAIREYWFPSAGPKTVLNRFTTTVDHVEQSGDLAVVRGTQVIDWTTGTQRFRTHGNYMTVLKRSSVRWRIAVQMAASAPVENLN